MGPDPGLQSMAYRRRRWRLYVLALIIGCKPKVGLIMIRTRESDTVSPFRLAGALTLLLLVAQNPIQAQTQPSNPGPRQSISLDGTWKLSPPVFSQTEPAKPAADAKQAARGFDDSSWLDAAVPGDWFGLFWDRWKDEVPAQKPNFI